MERRYWDSNIILTWLKKEAGWEKCQGIFAAFEKDDVQIVTSAITIAEVIYLKGHPLIAQDKSDIIYRFFENENILIINVDRVLAEYARKLIWENRNLRHNDALHIASAIRSKVSIMDTFDKDLIKLNGMIGSPPLRIGEPDIKHQLVLYEKPDQTEV